MSEIEFSKIEILKLLSKIVKAASVTITASTIIAEASPWITLTVLVAGSAADTIISFIKEKENENIVNSLKK